MHPASVAWAASREKREPHPASVASPEEREAHPALVASVASRDELEVHPASVASAAFPEVQGAHPASVASAASVEGREVLEERRRAAWAGGRVVQEGLHREALAALAAVQVAWVVSLRSSLFLSIARVRHRHGRMMST